MFHEVQSDAFDAALQTLIHLTNQADPKSWHGSRFTVEGKIDSRLRTVNPEPKTVIRYVVYDFRSIVNPDELLPKIEPCQKVPRLP